MTAQISRNPNRCLVTALRTFTTLFNLLPMQLRMALVGAIIQLVTVLRPKYVKIATQQIADAFPDESAAWHQSVAEASGRSFARAIVDFFRGPWVSAAWIDTHIEVIGADAVRAEALRTGKPVLFVGGHIGSFDLLAHLTGVVFGPLTFVIRNAKSVSVDRWWSEMREARGNTTLPRNGAIKGMLKALRSSRNVGILFDQNVTADFAVFVPWFGKLAATTKAVAMVALKTEVPVVVATLHYIGNERYRLEYQVMPVEDIYDSSASADEKAYTLTARAAAMLEAQIKKFPEQWFWMHRRWRTRPPAELSVSQPPYA